MKPFVPSSADEVEVGDFWAIPLNDGRFAAAVILSRVVTKGKPNKQLVVVGALDWAGPNLPSAEDLGAASVIASGMAHIDTIKHNSGEILGHLAKRWDSPKEVVFDSVAKLDLPSWGLEFIRHVAEKHFGNGRWVEERLRTAFSTKGGA